LEWVRAGVRAQRSKSRHRLDKFYEIEGLQAPPEEREMDLLIPPPPELGNTVVELVKAGGRVGEGEGQRWLFRGLGLSLKAGQCTGVVGRNGAGKTTLLRMCLGDRMPDEGTATIGKKVVFNYIDQARMQLDPTKTVMEEIAGKNEIVHFGDQKLSARSYLRRFLFADERVMETVGKLSGGERARLMLAKVLCRGGNVIVLDEPTNDLDLPSLRMLEEALIDFDGSVLVVSHDRYFLDRICDQIVAFEGAGVVVQTGNYSYYLDKRREREDRARQSAAAMSKTWAPQAAGSAAPAAKGSRARKLTFKEQRELEGMEATILTAEEEVAAMEKTLNDPSFFVSRAKEAPALVAQLESKKAEVARLYARWHELDAVAQGTAG
jgi:ATP-binding cassette subfamily F protein uup